MFKCPLCEKEYERLVSLSVHYKNYHKRHGKELVVKYHYNNVEPTCQCGCGEPVEYISIKEGFRKHARGHFRKDNENNSNIDEKKTFPKKLTFEEAYQRFKHRDDIELIESGYNGWRELSLFRNKTTGEEFWAKPRNVEKSKSDVYQNRKPKIVSLEMAKAKFTEQGRDGEIELIDKTYIKWTEKAQFLDKKLNKTWWAIPKSVYNRKSFHPSRKTEKTRQTNKEKYEKESYTQTEEYNQKSRQTNMEKRGVEYSSQCPKVKKKVRQTNLERHGKEYYTQTDEYRKIINCCWVVDLNIYFTDWYKQQLDPKPTCKYFRSRLNNRTVFSEELNKILSDYEKHKTKLEVFTEDLFNIKHYNNKPKEIKKFYKPDFKLNDKIYLNVDGLYWHCELNREKWYHFNLRKEFEDNGLRLFQFYENEIYNKTDIIKSIINSSFNKYNNQINSNDCIMVKVSQKEAEIFLNENDLKGTIASEHVGLCYNDEIVMVISYKQINNICIIERNCSVKNTNIVGGFDKLFSYLQKNCLGSNITEVHYWIDLRYEIEEFLLCNGFVKIKDELKFEWTDKQEILYHIKCETNINKRKEELGWHKIYGAGQRIYIKKIC